MALRRFFGLTLAVLPLAGLAACATSQGDVSTSLAPGSAAAAQVAADATPPAVAADTSVSQPAMATYNCTDGDRMTIQNLGTSLRVTASDGTSEELPAAPSDQRSRYGAEHDAVVLDGREALVMKGGHTPLACKR